MDGRNRGFLAVVALAVVGLAFGRPSIAPSKPESASATKPAGRVATKTAHPGESAIAARCRDLGEVLRELREVTGSRSGARFAVDSAIATFPDPIDSQVGERNVLLSRLSGTREHEVEKDWTFARAVLVHGVLPFVSLCAAQIPQLGRLVDFASRLG